MKEQWCIPPQQSAAFVCAMEDVPDVYEKPYDAAHPVVCFDERPCFLIADELEVIPAKPGQLERFDYTYKKCGSANVFGLFEPLQGRREMLVTERRTMPDFAHAIKHLVDELYPQAEQITVVLDNLATHTKAALYATFPPAQAHRLARKLNFIHTPKHGSWLNMVEIEFAALAKQCLDCHIPDIERLRQELAARTTQRNRLKATVNWHFTTNDARIKLLKLYPSNLSE